LLQLSKSHTLPPPRLSQRLWTDSTSTDDRGSPSASLERRVVRPGRRETRLGKAAVRLAGRASRLSRATSRLRRRTARLPSRSPRLPRRTSRLAGRMARLAGRISRLGRRASLLPRREALPVRRTARLAGRTQARRSGRSHVDREGRHDSQFIAARLFENRSTSRRRPAPPSAGGLPTQARPVSRRTGRAPSCALIPLTWPSFRSPGPIAVQETGSPTGHRGSSRRSRRDEDEFDAQALADLEGHPGLLQQDAQGLACEELACQGSTSFLFQERVGGRAGAGLFRNLRGEGGGKGRWGEVVVEPR
jgi:hypothetical protein